MRKDGTCAVCRKPIVVTVRAGLPEWLYVDPFCSATCARAYYDVPSSLPLPKGRPRLGEKREEAAQ